MLSMANRKLYLVNTALVFAFCSWVQSLVPSPKSIFVKSISICSADSGVRSTSAWVVSGSFLLPRGCCLRPLPHVPASSPTSADLFTTGTPPSWGLGASICGTTLAGSTLATLFPAFIVTGQAVMFFSITSTLLEPGLRKV